MKKREREGGETVCLCLPTCICTQVAFAAAAVAAVANKFVKLHSQFAVFLLSLSLTLFLSLSHCASGVARAATNKETPQYVSWSPQSTTARRPLLLSLSFSLPSTASCYAWFFSVHATLQFATPTAFTHFILLSRTRSFRSFVVSLYGRSELVFLQKLLYPSTFAI